MAYEKEKGSDLERAIDESLKAYAEGDKRFFEFIGEEARIYALDSAEPILGRRAFEAYFGATFTKKKRHVEVVKRDLQQAKGHAVLSQTLQIGAEGVESFVRQTVIWQEQDGRWQISHIHNAAVGQPIVTTLEAPHTASAIRVLNERIAAVAATVGVAQ